MGWHKVDIYGGDWIDRITRFVADGSRLCMAAKLDRAAILSKAAPMHRGARVYISPEASHAMQPLFQANGAQLCSEPRPEDVDTVEFEIGEEWQRKRPAGDGLP